MNILDTVKIPVFAVNATDEAWTAPAAGASAGVYFSDEVWENNDNAILLQGVTEGIARSVDYNTVMRQCTVMARLFSQILAYRNSLTRAGVSTPYANGSAPAPIGTTLLSTESSMDAHIGAMAEIFASGKFLADNEVDSRVIAASSVTEAKIKDAAVTNGKLADEVVTKAKLSSGLINTGSASANGITVSLSQGNSSKNRGFIIGVSSSKVTNAGNADYAGEALKVFSTTTTADMYLCGPTSTATGTYKQLCHVSGVYISGGTQVNATDFNVSSDVRLKENINPVGHNQVRAIVEGVDVKTFNYKDTPDRSTLGMLAQDILSKNTVLGELLVFENPKTHMLGIHENKLVYVLWDYVKQQNARISALEAKVEELLSR